MPFAKQKYSYVEERIKIAQQSKKQLKFENVASKIIQNIVATVS
jgi:hypothetical protein